MPSLPFSLFCWVFKVRQPQVVDRVIFTRLIPREGNLMSDAEYLLQHPWSDTPAAVRTSYAARNEALRQENAQLKELVVRLSAIIVQNAAQQR